MFYALEEFNKSLRQTPWMFSKPINYGCASITMMCIYNHTRGKYVLAHSIYTCGDQINQMTRGNAHAFN
jgi:hypothetical protein